MRVKRAEERLEIAIGHLAGEGSLRLRPEAGGDVRFGRKAGEDIDDEEGQEAGDAPEKGKIETGESRQGGDGSAAREGERDAQRDQTGERKGTLEQNDVHGVVIRRKSRAGG